MLPTIESPNIERTPRATYSERVVITYDEPPRLASTIGYGRRRREVEVLVESVDITFAWRGPRPWEEDTAPHSWQGRAEATGRQILKDGEPGALKSLTLYDGMGLTSVGALVEALVAEHAPTWTPPEPTW